MLRKHVLVVEDAASVRLVVNHFLQRMGVDVTQVDNGSAALEFLERESRSVDAFLIDLGLPDMSGQELARHASGNGQLIFMSGRPDVPADLPGPCLIKPFDEEALGAALDLVLGSSSSARS